MYPTKPKANLVSMLTALAVVVRGIVMGNSCQLPTITRKVVGPAKADSWIKRYSRWIQNERTDYGGYYLPFVRQLPVNLAQIRELVLTIDGSEVGHTLITLMISLINSKRALPITWLVLKGSIDHLPERLHPDLLSQLQAILPQNCKAIFLGDGEIDGIKLQSALQLLNLHYVCRMTKNTQLYEGEPLFLFLDLCLQPGEQISIPNIWFTQQGYGPVMGLFVGNAVIPSRSFWPPISICPVSLFIVIENAFKS